MRDPEFRDRPEFALHFPAGEEKVRPSVWRRLSRVMEVVIYALLLLAAVKLLGPQFQRRDSLVAEKERVERIRDEKESRVVRLRQEHRLLKTDRDYLETVARDRLDLQREGEHIVRIDRPKKD